VVVHLLLSGLLINLPVKVKLEHKLAISSNQMIT
jgi:hypothetical protein